MSATFKLMKGLGADAVTEISECTDWVVKFFNIDSCNAIESDYPVARPDDAGTNNANHSYESWCFLYMTQSPENQVNNFKLWGPAPDAGADTHPAAGVEIYLSSVDYSNGDTPTDANTMCNICATSHYSPGTAATFVGSCSAVSSPSGFFVMQMRVYASADIGNVQGEGCIYHISYDES
jgi:hypothetical protein